MAEDPALSGRQLFLARLAIGLTQGLALYLLYQAQDGQVHSWPATNGLAFEPLLMCWVFIPVLLSSSLGEMRWRRAVSWAGIAAVTLAILAFYDNWSAWPQDWVYSGSGFAWQPHITPSPQMFIFSAAGLSISHALVVGGHADRRFMATYPRHFDVAWKLALQIALTGLFVGIFWLLLVLGAGLFNLIKLDFFQKLIRHEWFAIPATTLAAAVALHLTDIRPALVRGARTLLLTLLSWLLPLLTLIVAGFLASLPFTGLAPLWGVGHASALLLVASAVVIVLINAAHQDGEAERMPPMLLRVAGSVAAILPVPLSLIAAYALFLRIEQYGWTTDRVMVAACVLVAVTYAAGYARAVLPPEPWLKKIERWNFYVALLVLTVLLALLTPVMNPTRIAVADQMARLNSGKIAPEKFDFKFLRWQGGRYGQAALAVLAHDKSAAVRDAANGVLRQTNRYQAAPVTPQSFAKSIIVHPGGATLPQNFLTKDWSKQASSNEAPACAKISDMHCEALLADLDGDGKPEIVVFSEKNFGAQVYRSNWSDWHLAGTITYPFGCSAILNALRSGHFQIAPPQQRWNDLAIGALRLHVTNPRDDYSAACPHSAVVGITQYQ